MNFELAVVEFPAKHLIGMKLATSMQKAQTDCPALWQAFGPRIIEIPSCESGCKGSFGVSVMLNENEFEYWAAVEAAPGTAIPDGMASMEISAGHYVKCTVPGVENLGAAFMYVYGRWAAEQSEYVLNMHAPGFELYPPDWRLNDSFEIYAPVTK